MSTETQRRPRRAVARGQVHYPNTLPKLTDVRPFARARLLAQSQAPSEALAPELARPIARVTTPPAGTLPPDPQMAGEPFHCCRCGRPHPRGICKACDDTYKVDGARPDWLRAEVNEVCKLNMRAIRNARRLAERPVAQDRSQGPGKGAKDQPPLGNRARGWGVQVVSIERFREAG